VYIRISSSKPLEKILKENTDMVNDLTIDVNDEGVDFYHPPNTPNWLFVKKIFK